MQTPPQDPASAPWFSHARRVARQVNVGWWLQIFTTPLVVAGLLGACALLMVRRMPGSPQAWVLGVATASVVAVIGVVCWMIARSRFEKEEQSLVRIEAAMKLRNGLSAARAGIAPWPATPPVVNAGLNWHWQRVVIPPVAALLFLGAGLLVPVPATGKLESPPEEPQSWQKIEADLEKLEENKDVIDQAYVEEMKKQLDELKKEDQQDWFSHSSLEATDSLKQKHAAELQRLERELGRANKAIGSLEKEADKMTPAQKQDLANQLDQAMQNLQNGALKPNSKLMEQLKGLDPSALGQMDPEKMKQLRENMKKAAEAAKECQGQGEGEGGKGEGKGNGQGDWNDELNDGNGNGDGEGNGQGQGDGEGEGDQDGNGDGKGSGGVSRGPGHSPGMLGKQHDQKKTGEMTPIESKDLSRAMPGDLLQLQDGEHDVDKTARGPQAGGATDAKGTGGDRVWKESLDPAEQKALKKFFE